MYNMDIEIFGYKLNLEIIILIGIIYLVLVGHTFCSCCHVGLMEGMTVDPSGNIKTDLQTAQSALQAAQLTAQQNKANATNLATQTTPGTVEGFVGANINYGQSSPYDLNKESSVSTSSWSAPSMAVVSGQPVSSGVTTFLNRPQQQIPLPKGEMLLFANTQFKPECCPNTYSNGSGCACMTGNQYNYLKNRGGNNVPYSEY